MGATFSQLNAIKMVNRVGRGYQGLNSRGYKTISVLRVKNKVMQNYQCLKGEKQSDAQQFFFFLKMLQHDSLSFY